MVDTFYIGAYWEDRKQSIQDVSTLTLNLIIKLAEIDKSFKSWYFKGKNRKEAKLNELTFDIDSLRNAFLASSRARKTFIDDNGFCEEGFTLNLWTANGDDDSLSLSIIFGSFNTGLTVPNNCIVSFPIEGEASIKNLGLSKLCLIMKTFIELLCPKRCVFTSHGLNNKLDVANSVGWITYVSNENTSLKGSFKEISINNGSLIYPLSIECWKFEESDLFSKDGAFASGAFN